MKYSTEHLPEWSRWLKIREKHSSDITSILQLQILLQAAVKNHLDMMYLVALLFVIVQGS